MRLHLPLLAAALVAASGGVASARAENTPLTDIPSFSYADGTYATWAGTLVATGAPTGPVKCPAYITYNAKVTITPIGPVAPNTAIAGEASYAWSPTKSVANQYDVSGAVPGGPELVNAPLVVSMMVVYKASTPPEGLPVSFIVKLSANTTVTQTLRLISHVQCAPVGEPGHAL